MVERSVKELVFCFENLEQITVPSSDVEAFFFVNVHTNIDSYSGNRMTEMLCMDEALIMLKPSADKHSVSSFGMEGVSTHSILERLYLYDDCVGIDLVFEDGSKKEIYVPWEDGSTEFVNKLQTVFTQKNEYLRGYNCFCVYFGKSGNLMKQFMEEK